MNIISWNVNGIRAIYKRDFLNWIKKESPDILCLQEIKANSNQLNPELLNPKGYFSYLNSAEKKGYSGVAVFTKKAPIKLISNLGLERFDREGRILELHYPNFILINLYLPHGGRKKENLNYKLRVYSYLLNYLEKMKDKKVILIGDFNIAHKEIDLARPKQNKNNIMFTKEERTQIDKLIALGFIDTFRKFHEKEIKYTWWPYFANARERNLGWRIDYAFSSKRLTSYIKNPFILSKILGSDHCPIKITMDMNP